mmetsp:Transcript_7391/g.18150  ORF Transcript_7391/g.18150 Transcript_7391/m.18150 type:complete len:352 (+) Transcript_7391:3709-4764(+)
MSDEADTSDGDFSIRPSPAFCFCLPCSMMGTGSLSIISCQSRSIGSCLIYLNPATAILWYCRSFSSSAIAHGGNPVSRSMSVPSSLHARLNSLFMSRNRATASCLLSGALSRLQSSTHSFDDRFSETSLLPISIQWYRNNLTVFSNDFRSSRLHSISSFNILTKVLNSFGLGITKSRNSHPEKMFVACCCCCCEFEWYWLLPLPGEPPIRSLLLLLVGEKESSENVDDDSTSAFVRRYTMVKDFDGSFVNSSGASGCSTDCRNRLDNWTPVSILSILEMSITFALIGSRPLPVAALNSPFKDMTRFVVMFKQRLSGENAKRRGSNFPDLLSLKTSIPALGSPIRRFLSAWR